MSGNNELIRYRKTVASLGRLAGHLDTRLFTLALVLQGELEARPFDLTALSAALSKPRPTVHRLVSDLVSAGDVKVHQDPADRRRSLLYLTEAGRKSLLAFLSDIENVLAGIKDGLSDSKAFYTALHKEQEITIDMVRSPLLRRLHEWALSKPDSIPADVFDAIYTVRLNRADLKESRFTHWGADMRTGRTDIAGYQTMGEFIREDSHDYYRMMSRNFEAAENKVALHQIQVGWDGPGTTYQRILISHDRLGLIGCARWLD